MGKGDKKAFPRAQRPWHDCVHDLVSHRAHQLIPYFQRDRVASACRLQNVKGHFDRSIKVFCQNLGLDPTHNGGHQQIRLRRAPSMNLVL